MLSHPSAPADVSELSLSAVNLWLHSPERAGALWLAAGAVSAEQLALSLTPQLAYW